MLVASRFTNTRQREAGSEVRRALLILDVVSTDAGEVCGKRGAQKDLSFSSDE